MLSLNQVSDGPIAFALNSSETQVASDIVQPCGGDIIVALNKSTSYRIISTVIIDAVLESDLSDFSVRLWMVIYQHSWSDQRGMRVLSTSYLSKRLNKSRSSIERGIRELKGKGYLVVMQQSDDTDGNLPRIVSARIPAMLADCGLKTRQRQTIKNPQSGEPCSRQPSDESPTNIQTIDQPEASLPTQDQPVCQQSTKKVDNVGLWRPKDSLRNRKKLTKEEMLATLAEMKHYPQGSPRTEVLGTVKNDTQTNNIKISINNPVKTVVDVFKPNQPKQHFTDRTNELVLARLGGCGYMGKQANDLLKQIEFATLSGVFADKELWASINICLKLIRSNRWRTPWGYVPC